MDKSTRDNQDDRSTSVGISRRTMVKGAAWSVPVIAVATATPAAAASAADVRLSGAWYSCNNGSWRFFFTVPSGFYIGNGVVFNATWSGCTSPNISITVNASNASNNPPASTGADRQVQVDTDRGKSYPGACRGGQGRFTRTVSGSTVCPIDILIADNTYLRVPIRTGSNGGTIVAYRDFYIGTYLKSTFTMGNAQNCASCA